MLKEPPAIAIADVVRCIRERLDQASATAQAAEGCAGEGHAEQAIQAVLDAEQPLNEVTAFLRALRLLRCADIRCQASGVGCQRAQTRNQTDGAGTSRQSART